MNNRKKNTIKIILFIAISIMTIFSFRCHSFAVINPADYEPASLTDSSDADELKDIANTIIGGLQIVGTIIAVIVLLVIGIKYMMGSAEEKAQFAKTMKPYIIGAVMVFAITNLLGIIMGVSGNLFG